MSVDMRPICPPEGECLVQIEQTVDMVLDIERSKRPRCKTLRPIRNAQTIVDFS